MEKCPELKTKRLILNTVTLDHASFLLRIMNTAEWLRYVGDRGLKTEEDARNYIRSRMFPQLEEHGHTSFMITEKHSGDIIGVCGIYVRDGLETPDLGFALLSSHYRKGFGYEAATRLLDFGFNHLGLQKILAITHPENRASQNLLKKLNFQFVEKFHLPEDPQLLFKFQIKNPSDLT